MPLPTSLADNALRDRLRDLEARVTRLESDRRSLLLTAGDGARVEVGVLDDTGLVGIRVYNSAGVASFTQTAT